MATWPATVPITRENFSESPPRRTIRSDMDVGPAKVRRRSTAAVRPVKLSLFLNDSQLDDLEEFYLDNDALSFDFVHPRTSNPVKARFTSEPEYSLVETMYRVSVDLEILP